MYLTRCDSLFAKINFPSTPLALLDARKYFLSRLNQGALKFCFVFLLQRSVEYPCVSVAALKFKTSTSSALHPTSNGMQAASNAPTATLIWMKLVRVLCETERPIASVITLGKQFIQSTAEKSGCERNPAVRSQLIYDQHKSNSSVCPRV